MTSSYPLSLLTEPPTWRGTALSGRSLDLLAVLAGSQDARVSDGALIEALWPDDAPARPLRALHVIVSRVRAAVGEGAVERAGDGYRLVLPAADVDVRDLADRAERARACAVEGQWDRVLDLTDSLPRVPARADADDVVGTGTTAVASLREHAAAHSEAARRDRGLALEATGDHEQAAELLREAAGRDAGDEIVLAALMRAESWTRSPSAALEIYEEHRRRLRETGAVPGPAMRAAHEAVLAAENPVRRGLEPEPEYFLGREADVAGVLKALSTHQLVTLTGPGGVGKTTLAQAVAARSRRPAVYVAALAELSPGADLVRALLDAVGSPGAADGDPRASLETIETLLDRLHSTDLPGIHLLELHLHRLQVLMSLGRYDQVVDACTRAEVLLDRVLPSWGEFFRTTLRLEGAYCAVYLDPRPETAASLLESLEPVDLPGTMRFIARSVRGELELTRGRVRTAALIQRVSLRYAGHWRSILGAGSQWELYILSMCLVTDVELSPDDAVELDVGAIRARAVLLLRDILSDPAPRQRDIPTVMAFAAAVGLSTAAAAPAGCERRAAGAELIATALAVGTNQTCRLLSHDYLRARTEQLDARALAAAERRIQGLDRARLVAHAAGLARRLTSETGWSRR